MNNYPSDRVETILGAFLQARGYKFVSGYNVGVGCGLVSRIQSLAVSGFQNPESGGFQNPESGCIWFLAVLKYGQKKKGSRLWLPFFFCLGECRHKCKYLCWVYLSISLFDKDDSVDLGQNETLFVFLVYAHLSLGA